MHIVNGSCSTRYVIVILLRSSLVFISKIELSFDPEFCPMVFYLTFVLFKIILFQFYINMLIIESLL